MGGLRRLRDLARHGKHHRNRVLCGGDHVAKRRVHHDHALLGGGVFVDVIRPDPSPANHLEVVRSCEDLFGNLGRGPDRQTVIVADHFEQFVLVLAKIGLEIHVNPAVAEDLNGGVREFVGDKYLGHVCSP